jgi:two-component system nitrogen regulation sensor histidine kinase GlnL
MTKAPIDFIWSSLPVPALLINPEEIITEANPAAEGFFNTSGKSLCGKFIWDRLVVSAPLAESFVRTKEFAMPLFVNDVEVGAAGQPKLQCNLTFAPVVQSPGNVIILFS